MSLSTDRSTNRIAYLSLQAVVEGQDTWAAVYEIVRGMREAGWTVDEWFVSYLKAAAPGPVARVAAMWRVQRGLVQHLGDYDAVYLRGHAPRPRHDFASLGEVLCNVVATEPQGQGVSRSPTPPRSDLSPNHRSRTAAPWVRGKSEAQGRTPWPIRTPTREERPLGPRHRRRLQDIETGP